jgi:hypothetical protein
MWEEMAEVGRVCPCFSGYEARDKQLVAFGLMERLAQGDDH